MRISDWSSDVCSSDLRDSDIALRSCGWQELVPERIDIGQAPAVESLIDPPGQHVDTVAPGGDIEQRDGIAAGLPSIELGIAGLQGPPVGVLGEEGFAVDEVAQCTGLAAQVTDHVQIGRASCRERVCQAV